MKTRLWIAAGVAALSLAGCNHIPSACTLELRVEVTPEEKTIAVGESFQAQATGVSCGGKQRFPFEQVTWTTGDTNVIALNATTGQITGLAPGTATVTAVEPGVTAPHGIGTVHVTVRAP